MTSLRLSRKGAVEAMKQGAYDYIIKPFNPDDLEHTIQKAIEERKQLVSENKQLRTKRLDELNLLLRRLSAPARRCAPFARASRPW